MKIVVVSFVLGAVFAFGWWAGSIRSGDGAAQVSTGQEREEATLWTCPMHPQIKLPEPGTCPICGMTLVALTTGGDDVGPRELSMSPADRKLAEILTAPVEYRFVTKKIRMVGKVDYDETRIRTISAWIPGLSRLEQLYVDYTGVEVRKGDHLVLLYSPELFVAQEELLEARRQAAQSENRSPTLAGISQRAYASARDKLRLWGLTLEQIDEIEQRGTSEDQILINSPGEGIVIHKALNEGDYVQAGTRIYQIAQLDHLWVVLDAYEQDLSWLRYGQEVTLQTEAYPGEVFGGWISFIDWDVGDATRTIKVRVNVENPDRRLKPGMFVRAVVQASVAQGGRVMAPELSGKWICPMHPEVVSDTSGQCEICGMNLVTAEDLGYVTASDPSIKPLVVPASAVLVTGKRAVVYVEVPGKDRPTFEGREVTLGPRTDEHYIILAGLQENERVVVNGAFKIDSALQIQAKASMMSMKAEASDSQARTALVPVYEAYLGIQAALAGDDLPAAGRAFETISGLAGNVDGESFSDEMRPHWEALAEELASTAAQGIAAGALDEARSHFDRLSQTIIALHEHFGHAGQATYFVIFCPMAFDGRGARWLQDREQVSNPYYGATMPACGELEKSIPGRGDR